MTIEELHHKLQYLESKKVQLENEILEIKRQIEHISPFTKEQKFELFKSLFIGRSDVFAKYWVSRDGLKKGYSTKTYTFKGSDYIPVSNEIKAVLLVKELIFHILMLLSLLYLFHTGDE